MGVKVLVINMWDYMKGLQDRLASVYGAEIIVAKTVEDAIEKMRAGLFSAAVIAFHPQINPDTSMGISSGLEMWKRILKKSDEDASRIPIVITVESQFFNTTIEMQINRYGITNPYIILSGKDWNEGDLSRIADHFRLK